MFLEALRFPTRVPVRVRSPAVEVSGHSTLPLAPVFWGNRRWGYCPYYGVFCDGGMVCSITPSQVELPRGHREGRDRQASFASLGDVL